MRTLFDTVRPGGLLVAVYHDRVAPADYIGADDLGWLLNDDFTVDLHPFEPRIDPPPDTPNVPDVVVRAGLADSPAGGVREWRFRLSEVARRRALGFSFVERDKRRDVERTAATRPVEHGTRS